MEFSPDGRTLAGGVRGAAVCFWDVASGKLMKSIKHEDSVVSVTYSPDGGFIASAMDNGKIQFWDVATAELQKTLPNITPHISSVACSSREQHRRECTRHENPLLGYGDR